MSININPFLDLDTNGRGSAVKAEASRPVAVNLNPFLDVAGIGPWDIDPANEVVIGRRRGKGGRTSASPGLQRFDRAA